MTVSKYPFSPRGIYRLRPDVNTETPETSESYATVHVLLLVLMNSCFSPAGNKTTELSSDYSVEAGVAS